MLPFSRDTHIFTFFLFDLFNFVFILLIVIGNRNGFRAITNLSESSIEINKKILQKAKETKKNAN